MICIWSGKRGYREAGINKQTKLRKLQRSYIWRRQYEHHFWKLEETEITATAEPCSDSSEQETRLEDSSLPDSEETPIDDILQDDGGVTQPEIRTRQQCALLELLFVHYFVVIFIVAANGTRTLWTRMCITSGAECTYGVSCVVSWSPMSKHVYVVDRCEM